LRRFEKKKKKKKTPELKRRAPTEHLIFNQWQGNWKLRFSEKIRMIIPSRGTEGRGEKKKL